MVTAATGVCLSNLDCPNTHWCRQASSNGACLTTRECVAKKNVGGACIGASVPCFHEQCLDHLACVASQQLPGAPGVCAFKAPTVAPPVLVDSSLEWCATGPCPPDRFCERSLVAPFYTCTLKGQTCCAQVAMCTDTHSESGLKCTPEEARLGECIRVSVCCHEKFCRRKGVFQPGCNTRPCNPGLHCVGGNRCEPIPGGPVVVTGTSDDDGTAAWVWVLLALSIIAILVAAVAVVLWIRKRRAKSQGESSPAEMSPRRAHKQHREHGKHAPEHDGAYGGTDRTNPVDAEWTAVPKKSAGRDNYA